MQVNFAIDGSGASQRSVLTVMQGNFSADGSGNTIFSGGIRGTYDLAEQTITGRYGVSVSTEPAAGSGSSFFGGLAADGAPNYFVLGQNGTDASNNRVIEDGNRIVVGAASNSGTTGNQWFRSQTVASYAGQISTSAPSATFMNGYAAGLQDYSSGGFAMVQSGGYSADPTKFVVRFQPGSNSVTSTMQIERADGTNESFKIVSGARPSSVASNASAITNTDIANIQNSGYTTFDQGSNRSALIDATTWNARDMTESTGAGNMLAGLGTTANATDSAVQTRTYILPSTALPSGVLSTAFPSVTFNNFEKMQWGFWGGQVTVNATLTGASSRNDRYNLATWVGGSIPSVASMPATGTATYNGHAIGTVFNNGDRYIAAGSYQQTWNFASGTGSVTISNFDGSTYTSNLISGADATQFKTNTSTSLTNGSGRTGMLIGSFFSGNTDAAKNVGGNFALSGTNYRAAGIVAGQR
jgi:hypothetical protein